jgi:DNA-binding IclR family transcriptional regulator
VVTVLNGSKAKIARRVIQVLDFIDDEHGKVTVMDIVRRYEWPQSSTSELLSILVELGLLYKQPGSRHYTLTPRAAILGSHSQPEVVRDGRLSTLLDRLGAQTGLGTALFGLIGRNAQMFRWTAGSTFVPARPGMLRGGAQETLVESAAGWLLLSTLQPGRRDGVIHRLNAEAPAARKFSYEKMVQRVRDCGRFGFAVGPAGFDSTAQMAAVLFRVDPNDPADCPMVLSLVYEPHNEIDPDALVTLLRRSAQRCIARSREDMHNDPAVSSAA